MKKSKNLTTKDLFEYLDIYTFVWDFEIISAIEDFYRENKIITSPSWWECFFFSKLADDYIKDRKLTFTN